MPLFIRKFIVGLGVCGVLLLGFAAVLANNVSKFASTAVRADGVVVRDNGRPVVEFVADGQRVVIQARSRTNPPRFRAGDRVAVLYPPGEPNEARIDALTELWLAPILLAAFGSIMSLIVWLTLRSSRRAALRRERAREFGRRFQAKVTSVCVDGVVVLGRSPWIVTAEASDAGRTLTFKSQRLWEDPTPFYPVGSDIAVYCLDGDPKVSAFQFDRMQDLLPREAAQGASFYQ